MINSSSKAEGFRGNANQKNFFPFGEELIFNASHSRGSAVHYEWDFGDGSPREKYYLTSDAYHNYSKPGTLQKFLGFFLQNFQNFDIVLVLLTMLGICSVRSC